MRLDDVFLIDIVKPGKKVVCRIDINSPIGIGGEILDITRFKEHEDTIRYFINNNNGLVLLAHQGRPGKKDFTSLNKHAEILREILDYEVKYVPDVVGEQAINAIKNMHPGDIILLDNVRFVEDEYIVKSIEEHARSKIVRVLHKFFDYFVLDGFSVAHRQHASVVGFTTVLPSAVGKLMEKEIRNLSWITAKDVTRAVILGGAKTKDAVKYVDLFIKTKKVEKIMLSGLVAFIFHVVSGLKVPIRIREEIARDYRSYIPKIKELVKSRVVEFPEDYAIDVNGRKEVHIDECSKIESMPKDIGHKTVEKYVDMSKDYDVIVMRGPAGLIEKRGFDLGTKKLLGGLINIGKQIMVCGGHLISVLKDLNIPETKYRKSTAGGAALEFIANGTLPGIEALKLSKKLFEEKIGKN